MRLARVILRVSDLGRALRFWTETVGLEVISSSEAFAFLDGGGAQVVLNQVGSASAQESLTEVVFESEDFVADHHAMSERGVPFEVEPRPVTSNGDRDLMAAHFRDPDGNLASLTGWVARPA